MHTNSQTVQAWTPATASCTIHICTGTAVKRLQQILNSSLDCSNTDSRLVREGRLSFCVAHSRLTYRDHIYMPVCPSVCSSHFNLLACCLGTMLKKKKSLQEKISWKKNHKHFSASNTFQETNHWRKCLRDLEKMLMHCYMVQSCLPTFTIDTKNKLLK